MGTGVEPGEGLASKHPNFVWFDGAHVANVGRTLNRLSWKGSVPVVMLKGIPELAITNGLRRKPLGRPIVPPRKSRWRMSKVARPLSSWKFSGFDGKLFTPEVSLFARLYV